MLKRKMVLIVIAMVISTVWMFTGYAAAQGPRAPGAMTQEQILKVKRDFEQLKIKAEAIKKTEENKRKENLAKAIHDKTGFSLDEFNKFIGGKSNFIPVFIDPELGTIFVPGDEVFTSCSGAKADDLNKFIDAENVGKNKSLGQFFTYQKNPYCFWYVDPQGQLRQKCIP